jgi:hypothetical protein
MYIWMKFIYRPCGHSTEIHGSVADKESLNQPKDYQILRNASGPET